MSGLLKAILSLSLVACSNSSGGPPSGGTSLVVGVQSDNMGGLVGSVHIVTKVNGAVSSDDLLTPPGGSRVDFPPPWEKKLTPPSGTNNGQVDVEVDAFAGADSTSPDLIQRLASTQFVPGETLLLRVHLESRCIVFPPTVGVDAGVDSGDAGTVPGPLSGPTCTSPQTCIAGLCQADTVSVSQLEPYAPDWATNAPDICKPANARPPDVQAGTGQTDYTALTDGETLQAQQGPQGGHHIWIALRQKNLKQAGSTTTVSGVEPQTMVAIPPSGFVFTFEPDEGGYCKLFGLRYQLDNDGIDYTQFLGKPLDVTIKVVDSSGAMGSATAHINIAPTILIP
jgi:hypothetical protein